MSQKKIINSIQILRGLAAVVVVIYHVSGYMKMHYSQTIFGDIFRIGFAGVDLFFVISGFIIYFTAKDYLNKPERFQDYWKKRIIRIYPIYWLVVIGIQVLQWLLSKQLNVASFSTEYEGGILQHLGTYTLFPHHVAIDPVTWTLSYELYFYVLFSLLILSRKLWVVPFVVLIVSIFNTFTEPEHSRNYYDFLFSNFHYEFLMGVLICYFSDKLRFSKLMSLGTLGLAIAIITVWGYEVGDSDNIKRILVFGFAASLLLISMLNLEQHGYLQAPKFLMLLGGASYVLYLIHFPFLLILNKFPTMLGIILDTNMMSVYNYTIIFINIFVAIFLHQKLELPLTSFLSKRFK